VKKKVCKKVKKANLKDYKRSRNRQTEKKDRTGQKRDRERKKRAFPNRKMLGKKILVSENCFIHKKE
jgi:hypothetical protein